MKDCFIVENRQSYLFNFFKKINTFLQKRTTFSQDFSLLFRVIKLNEVYLKNFIEV